MKCIRVFEEQINEWKYKLYLYDEMFTKFVY